MSKEIDDRISKVSVLLEDLQAERYAAQTYRDSEKAQGRNAEDHEQLAREKEYIIAGLKEEIKKLMNGETVPNPITGLEPEPVIETPVESIPEPVIEELGREE